MDSKDFLIRFIVQALDQSGVKLDQIKGQNNKFMKEVEDAYAQHVKRLEKMDQDRVKSTVTTEDRITQERRAAGDKRVQDEKKFDEEEVRNTAKKEAARLSAQVKADKDLERLVANREKRERSSADRAVRDARKLGDEVQRALKAPDGEGGFFNFLKKLGSELSHDTDSAAKLSAQLRGFAILGVAAFAQQLLTILTSLGGAFLAVASSAAYAGTAIGAAMTSAAAQALPALGLIVAAFGRIGAVFKAVQQAGKQAATAAGGNTSALEAQRNAANRVREAHEALKDALDRVKTSQEDLTEARRKATRELEDLIDAEERARNANAAAEDQFDNAVRARRQAQQSGDIIGQQSAAIDVEGSRLDLRQTRRDSSRSIADANRTLSQGIESPALGFKDAERQLKASEQAAKKAGRALKEAEHDAETAGAKVAGAGSQLNALLSQLDGAELRLYKALSRLQKKYRETFRPITDIIVNAFTRGVDRASKVLDNQKLIKPLTTLARAIATSMDRVSTVLTSSGVIEFFGEMSKQSAKSLPLLTDIALAFFKIFQNIAGAGGEALRTFLGYFVDLTNSWAKSTGDTDRLSKFFKLGAEIALDWFSLAGSVVKLFAALAGAGGASTGTQIINDLTGAIDGQTEAVDKNKEGTKKFFQDSREVLHQIGRVLVAIGKSLAEVFNPDSTRNFADVLIKILLPALVNATKGFDLFVSIALKFFDLPFVGEVGKWVLSLTIFFGIISKVIGTLGIFSTVLGPVIRAIGLLAVGFFELATAAAPAIAEILIAAAPFIAAAAAIALVTLGLKYLIDKFGIVKVAIGAAIAVLVAPFVPLIAIVTLVLKKFGVLDDVANALVGTFKAVTHWVGDAAVNAFNALVGALGAAGHAVKSLARAIINGLGDALDFLRGIPGKLVALAKRAVTAYVNVYKTIGSKIVEVLGDGFSAVYGFFRKLPGRLKSFGEKAAEGFVDGMKGLPDLLYKALKSVGKGALSLDKVLARLIDKALPDKIALPGLPDVDLPNNPLKSIGAYRGGGYAAQDIMVSPGEEIVSPYGGSTIVPGNPTAADSVLMRGVRAGSAVLTWTGRQMRNMGASLQEAVAGQLPHFAKGGWLRTGFTVDRGSDPKQTYNNEMSYAELLVAGANAGFRNKSLARILGQKIVSQYGAGNAFYGEKPPGEVLVRADSKHKAYKIIKSDVGSGQGGDPRYTIDLHGRIADLIAKGGKGFLEVAKVGTPNNAGVENSGGKSGGKPIYKSRDVLGSLFPSISRAASSAVSGLAGFGSSGIVPNLSGSSPLGNFTNSVIGSAQQLGQNFTQDLAARVKIGTEQVQVGTTPTSGNDRAVSKPTASAFAHPGALRGVGSWYGKRVANWIIPYLQYARSRGFTAPINNGFRTYAEQKRIYDSGVRPAAVPGTSNHEGANFPRGAIDMGSKANQAPQRKFESIISKIRGRYLHWAGQKDAVHFSYPHNGSYRRGGIVGRGLRRFATGGFTQSANKYLDIAKRPSQSFLPAGPDTLIDYALSALHEVGVVTKALVGKTLAKSRDLGKAITNLFADTVDTGGFFDQFVTAFTNLQTESATAIKKQTYSLSKRGDLLRRNLSPTQIAEKSLSDLQDQYQLLIGEKGFLNTQLAAAKKALAIATKKKSTKGINAANTVIIKITDALRTLDSAIGDAIVAIGDAAEAALQAAVDKVNQAVSDANADADLRDRVADLKQKQGDIAGAFSDRGQDLLIRRAALQFDQANSGALLQQANAQGNTELSRQLVQHLNDLEVQLAENAQAIIDNTVAARAAATAFVNARISFGTGLSSGLQGLLAAIHTAAGQDGSTAGMGPLIQIGINALVTGIAKLEDMVNTQTNGLLDLRGLTPEQIVARLSTLDIDQLEAALGIVGTQAANDLEDNINAIISNNTALETNTAAMHDLSNSVSQSFSSTAWQTFRQAIFDGNGGLLPHYPVPMMDTGGSIMSDGYIYGHAGEEIIKAAKVDRKSNGWAKGDINLNVTEPMEVADPVVMGAKLAWAAKHEVN